MNDTKVINNVKGYTIANGELVTFSSIAFENGKVLKTSKHQTLNSEYSSADVIDGEGRIMLPGLIDAHGHVMGLGFQEIDINVAGIESLDATLDSIATYAESYPDLDWIQGRGWNHTRWTVNRFPTAEELDQAVSERPVWLRRVDGHAGWANSKAMELAGITKDTEDPAGGKIIRDEEGNPTGVFVDAAMGLVGSELPPRSDEEKRLALEKALQKMAAHGLTSVHDAGVSVDAWNLYKEFADQGKLKTRIYGMISGAGDTFDKLSSNGPIESYANDKLALRSVKLYADGALGSRGAAMIKPYSDDPDNRGLLFESEDEMTEMIMKTASKGYQTNIHAIGDRGNRVVLNAFERVKDSLGNKGLRHRMEHAQIVSLEDIPRFLELNIIASMQPTHATSDMNMAEDRVGPDRIKGGYAWSTFLEQGTVVAAGSDFPVEHVNPFFGLYSAITRQDHQGNPEGGWYPEEKLSRVEALRAFTIDAAYAAHQEDELGSLETGKWADFILVDRDIFEVPTSEIWQTEVLETWVAGEKVYQKK
ncbi:MAG: amidohydrolase [Balneolaceae bacterium]|nr:amidohydrolase [Balneolaceae bacterium]